ncbi:MAG: hypothetical protein KGQ37_09390 [Hyphomicrobiales bacterium]|nr:hypothetical protein [Hyphomicrobiales bacterium]
MTAHGVLRPEDVPERDVVRESIVGRYLILANGDKDRALHLMAHDLYVRALDAEERGTSGFDRNMLPRDARE